MYAELVGIPIAAQKLVAEAEDLEGVVQNFRGALLVVSHDEVFLEHCGVTEALVLG